MLDIKWIRENPEKFDVAMGRRNNAVKAVDILQIDEEKRKQTFLIQELQAKRNGFAKEIANVKKAGGNADALLEDSKKTNIELSALENDFTQDEKLREILIQIPMCLRMRCLLVRMKIIILKLKNLVSRANFLLLQKIMLKLAKSWGCLILSSRR